MKLRLEIIQCRGKEHFRIYDDINGGNADLLGVGWTVTDAVLDFLDQYNALSFFDDDTPVLLSDAAAGIRSVRTTRRA